MTLPEISVPAWKFLEGSTNFYWEGSSVSVVGTFLMEFFIVLSNKYRAGNQHLHKFHVTNQQWLSAQLSLVTVVFPKTLTSWL